jgi:hypothetical protein
VLITQADLSRVIGGGQGASAEPAAPEPVAVDADQDAQ